MHAALDINMPNYASAIVTTKEVIAATPLQGHDAKCEFACHLLEPRLHFHLVQSQVKAYEPSSLMGVDHG
jgi:hypothetical protein